MTIRPGQEGKRFSSRRPTKGKESTSYKPADFCMRCGGVDHIPPDCPYVTAVCRKCGIKGHLAKRCLTTSASGRGNKVNRGKGKQRVHALQQPETTVDDSYNLFHVNTMAKAPDPIMLDFDIDGHRVVLELDTGAAYSLIPESIFRNISTRTLKPVSTILTSFTGQVVKIVGSVQVEVTFRGIKEKLPLMIYSGEGPKLCGRSWLFSKLKIWNGLVNSVNVPLQASREQSLKLSTLLRKHSKIFEGGLGTMKGVLVHLNMKPDAQPKFSAARPVPYALRDRVEAELVRLEKAGIISPIGHAEYATPVVTVLKKDNTVRLCGDFKSTVNPNLDTECYPLPKVEDIFAKIAGGRRFSKLDLRDAFNQLELDEDSKKVVVINTHKGLFKYHRLPFGISSSPAIFQREIENLIQGIPGVSNFQDDILVTGTDDETHLKSLAEVFFRIEESGLKLRREKCEFFMLSVTHLGYRIDSEGLHPLTTKLDAIMNAPAPECLDQLRSFIGLITYYGKFIPNQSTLFAPLYKLLNKGQEWSWGDEQKEAFKAAKEAICESSVLVHYDPSRELLLACDASPYGLGAVLSHPGPNGSPDQPIAFASRSLTKAEKNYSQLEREALSLVFGVTKFREYLIGHTFTLQTDHQPLVSLLSEKKPVPRMAAARIQRWALTLAAYSYKMVHRKGKLHGNADALSRLPLEVGKMEVPEPMELVLLAKEMQEDDKSWNAHRVRECTWADPTMRSVLMFVENGWPQKHTLIDKSGAMPYYYTKRLEMSVLQGVLLWGARVVIPPDLRKELLAELHDGHQGMTLMKSLARSKVWWPGIDSDIERWVACCSACQQTAPMPAANVYAPWPKAANPWDKVHMDYAGPVEGKMLLVVVDSHSKWIEVEIVSTASAQVTASKLRQMFAKYGLPYTVVSDNGTHFTGTDVTEFFRKNGIRHLTIAPYHPASNGQAERAVRIIKEGLNKITTGLLSELNKTAGPLQMRLDRVLMNYRRTPVTSTGKAPAELFLGRSIRTRLDNLRPRLGLADAEPKVGASQSHQEKGKMIGARVYARNYGKGSKWLSGEISGKIGNAMFEIKTPKGNIRRHGDQIRLRQTVFEPTVPQNILVNSSFSESIDGPATTSVDADPGQVSEPKGTNVPVTPVGGTLVNDSASDAHAAPSLRRSTRLCN